VGANAVLSSTLSALNAVVAACRVVLPQCSRCAGCDGGLFPGKYSLNSGLWRKKTGRTHHCTSTMQDRAIHSSIYAQGANPELQIRLLDSLTSWGKKQKRGTGDPPQLGGLTCHCSWLQRTYAVCTCKCADVLTCANMLVCVLCCGNCAAAAAAARVLRKRWWCWPPRPPTAAASSAATALALTWPSHAPSGECNRTTVLYVLPCRGCALPAAACTSSLVFIVQYCIPESVASITTPSGKMAMALMLWLNG
jgi:hypothetical protein